MSLSDSKQNAVLLYCGEECCSGHRIDAEPLEEDDVLDCPICYESLEQNNKLASLDPCGHFFCCVCIQRWQLGKNGCPVCRQKCTIVHISKPTSRPVRMSSWWKKLDKCCFKDPSVSAYFSAMNETWRTFCCTIINMAMEVGIKGVEHLDLKKYKEQGQLMSSSKTHLKWSSKSGKVRFILAILLPNLSMRLVITEEEYRKEMTVDDEYADEAVRCLNEQMITCWRVLPNLLNRDSNDHVFIRRFEDANCYLLLSGFRYSYRCHGHKDIMREKLDSLLKCNFDSDHYEELRDFFPNVSLKNLKTCKDYHAWDCNCN